MQIVINILTWNDARYLPDLFASIAAQTYEHVTIRVLDNGSTDGTLTYIKHHHPQYLVARNLRNQGSAVGHNQLIRFALERWGDDLQDKAILLLNADTVLHPQMLEELVIALQADTTLGATQPKVLRAYADVTLDDDVEHNVKSDILDTTGYRLTGAWQMTDRGAGEMDTGQYDDKRDVIGATGVSALWRATTLQAMSINHEAFDTDFFAYREDADLALRARRAGWRTVFVPSARAHHYRGLPGAARSSLWSRWSGRRVRRPSATALLVRNQLFFLLKNLTCGDFIRAWPKLMLNVGVSLVYGCLFEPETRKLLLLSSRLFVKMLGKRRLVFVQARESGKLIRSYVGI